MPAREGGSQGDDGRPTLKSDDFPDLAALWSADPPADEEAELKRLARRTPQHARLTQWGELAAVLLLFATISLAMIWNLGLETVLIGSLILLLLAWSAWKRHRLGSIALLIDERDRISFVTSTLRAKAAELDRSALGIAFVLPGIFLTMLLGYSMRGGHAGEGELVPFLIHILTTPRGLVVVGLLCCAMMLLTLSHLRLRDELARLRTLRAEYEDEQRLDDLHRP